MKTIHQLVIGHDHSWQKWPDTDDQNFEDLLAKRTVSTYERDGEKIQVVSRYYPTYLPYLETGCPFPSLFPVLNNSILPDEKVMDRQREVLRKMAKECDVILWDHVHQCFPPVARVLPELFKLKIVAFADDAPGSTEIKTLPVIENFDVLYHQMWTFNFETGERVQDVYRRVHRNLDMRFLPATPVRGLVEKLRELDFSIEKKVEGFSELPIDFVFVGALGPQHRTKIMVDLVAELLEHKRSNLRYRFHGKHRLGHGPLLPLHPLEGDGAVVAPLYVQSKVGFNTPVSSIFNCRLFDLWLSGVVQIVQDPHNELEAIGAGDMVVKAAASASEIVDQIVSLANDPASGKRALDACYWAMNRLMTHNPTSAFRDIYFDHLEKIS